MISLLFIIFSGHASAIFDDFLLNIHSRYLSSKDIQGYKPSEIFIIETQWDSGGNTGFMNNFHYWIDQNDKLEMIKPDIFMPPPMGDLKSQISRWSEYLVKDDFGKNVKTLFESRYKDIDDALFQLESLLKILKRISPEIFFAEDQQHFLKEYKRLYIEFVQHSTSNTKHSVGNLFLSFLYLYSSLVLESIETIHDHQHQIFFNFLKDLNLIPRGVRLEFLIDGTYNLIGKSFDGVDITTEKLFDDYSAEMPVDPSSYSLQVTEGNDIEDRFHSLLNRSDLVIIPPGSLSNWMPLLNKFSSQLQNKNLLWIVNSFTHISEISLRKQIEYILGLGLDPVILAPTLDNPFDILTHKEKIIFEQGYKEQGKSPINLKKTFSKFKKLKVIKSIPFKELGVNGFGIKYDQKFIEYFLIRLMEKCNTKLSSEEMYLISQDIVSELKNKNNRFKFRFKFTK